MSVLGTVGLRINPLVGAGQIAALSTATASSKFGIPLSPLPDGAKPYRHTDIALLHGSSNEGGDIALLQRRKIVQLYVDRPYLCAVMCHVGSQVTTTTTLSILDLIGLVNNYFID